MKKTLREDVDKNQDVTLKPLSHNDALKMLDKYNLLPWLNKKLENIYGKDDLSKKNQAEKQPVEKVSKKEDSNKNSTENKQQATGLQNTAQIQAFHNSPAGKAVRAAMSKRAEIDESMLKAMYADGLKQQLLKLAKLIAQKNKEEVAKDKLNRAWAKYYQQQEHVRTERQQTRTFELAHPHHIVQLPAYRTIMEEYDREMSKLQTQMQAIDEETMSWQGKKQAAADHNLIIERGLLKTGDFLSDIEDLSPEERLEAMAEEHERLANKVEVKLQAEEPVEPAKMQMMQLRIKALDQEMQLANAELKQINPEPAFRPDRDLNNMSEESKEQAEKLLEKQKFGFKHVWHAFCNHRVEQEAAFDKKLHECFHKHDQCFKSQELLKTQKNAAINDLVASNPELNQIPAMRPVPIQVSTTKPLVKPSMSPKPEAGFKKYKEEWCSFFANKNLTKGELLEQVDKQLPVSIRDYAKNFINQALADVRPGDRISPQAMEALQKQMNQQNTAPSPFRMSPRPMGG